MCSKATWNFQLGSVQANGWASGVASSVSYPAVAPGTGSGPTRCARTSRAPVYCQDYLAEKLRAVWDNSVNVVGALAWRFADNNEFGSYVDRYDMQAVNRTDGALRRTYKRSI
ncbi:f4186579-abfa-4ee0-aac6-0879130b74a3 [Thermothielavioides terrestris]|uniref:F4186579-abfa-4ee0-aac6-0879130b74a3 n=1 Tax=Thermothielavioides terrestris TaxID=2587410 RepID=A0A3S4F4H4_9PEZI|nr:f4186579-abfa-4ee0-aac6-0879130b74a3 [Thermothielavioides terrestris]